MSMMISILSTLRRNRKTIEIYDSLRDSNVTKYREIASNLIGYLHKEWKDKKVGGSCDKAHWKSTLKKGIPQQNNGVDCGVFVIRFAQSLAEGRPLKAFDAKKYRLRLLLSLIHNNDIRMA
eukprot:1005142_1